MAENKANPEAKLYGLRYISTYAHELNRLGQRDVDLADQILLLALMTGGGLGRKSQLGQEIFALAMNGFMTGGYFVEVGAHHSSQLSNTWLLEKKHGWRGLLLEPNPEAWEELRQQRSAALVGKAAWNKSGERLTFNAVADSALSRLEGLPQSDEHDRSNFHSVEVETITLNDALAESGAPKLINYMSIDVEGAEIQVLDGLDLREWQVRALTIEFNHDKERLAAYDQRLLAAGYLRVFDIISDFDAWYVKGPELAAWRKDIRMTGLEI